MTAKTNDRKERWLQENNDCNKAMTAKNRPLQRAVLEVWSLPRKLRFHIFNFQILKEVSHESFHCTSSTCRFWRKSRTKASFAQLQLADYEGNSHESFVFTSSTCRFWRKSRTKASIAQLQLADFEGNSHWKLRFHIFNSQILKDARAKAFLCTTSTCRFWKGSLARKLDQGDKMRRTTDLSLANHSGTNPCVFILYLIPNSISFSITYSTTYSYYQIPITCVFAVKVGLLSPCVQKHRENKIILSSLANAWATWENTGNRNR